MKKFLGVILALCVFFSLAACNKKGGGTNGVPDPFKDVTFTEVTGSAEQAGLAVLIEAGLEDDIWLSYKGDIAYTMKVGSVKNSVAGKMYADGTGESLLYSCVISGKGQLGITATEEIYIKDGMCYSYSKQGSDVKKGKAPAQTDIDNVDYGVNDTRYFAENFFENLLVNASNPDFSLKVYVSAASGARDIKLEEKYENSEDAQDTSTQTRTAVFRFSANGKITMVRYSEKYEGTDEDSGMTYSQTEEYLYETWTGTISFPSGLNTWPDMDPDDWYDIDG